MTRRTPDLSAHSGFLAGTAGQSVAGVPAVGDCALVAAAILAEAGERPPVESVVLVGRHFAPPIGMLSPVADASEEETEEVP